MIMEQPVHSHELKCCSFIMSLGLNDKETIDNLEDLGEDPAVLGCLVAVDGRPLQAGVDLTSERSKHDRSKISGI